MATPSSSLSARPDWEIFSGPGFKQSAWHAAAPHVEQSMISGSTKLWPAIRSVEARHTQVWKLSSDGFEQILAIGARNFSATRPRSQACKSRGQVILGEGCLTALQDQLARRPVRATSAASNARGLESHCKASRVSFLLAEVPGRWPVRRESVRGASCACITTCRLRRSARRSARASSAASSAAVGTSPVGREEL